MAESYLESRAAAKRALEMLELEWANIEAGHRWASEKSTGETGAALRSAYGADAALVREWTTSPKELARWAKEGLFAARQLDDREAAGLSPKQPGPCLRPDGTVPSGPDVSQTCLVDFSRVR